MQLRSSRIIGNMQSNKIVNSNNIPCYHPFTKNIICLFSGISIFFLIFIVYIFVIFVSYYNFM
jgi:hypothetical protein